MHRFASEGTDRKSRNPRRGRQGFRWSVVRIAVTTEWRRTMKSGLPAHPGIDLVSRFGKRIRLLLQESIGRIFSLLGLPHAIVEFFVHDGLAHLFAMRCDGNLDAEHLLGRIFGLRDQISLRIDHRR